MNGLGWKLIGMLVVFGTVLTVGIMIGGSWGTSMAEDECDCEQVEEVEEETSEAEESEEGAE